jgi:hypothetical protein
MAVRHFLLHHYHSMLAQRVQESMWNLLDAKEARHVDEVLPPNDVVHKPDDNRRTISNLHAQTN